MATSEQEWKVFAMATALIVDREVAMDHFMKTLYRTSRLIQYTGTFLRHLPRTSERLRHE